ncbi:(d)CMP kinase [Mycoplasma sp. ATU-Cv-508]|uniref:(d)CMP kinase n=1 Tax=Mycoplasma sp. ATU-Cv-508 TaxID=2048001 RepID=UPI000FDEB922
MSNSAVSRFSLWKEYRAQIEENIKLQKAVQNSSEKFQILNRRLVEAFPDYHQKYQLDQKSFASKLAQIDSPPEFTCPNLPVILAEIERIEQSFTQAKVDFSDLNFSLGRLTDLISDLRSGKNKQKFTQHFASDADVTSSQSFTAPTARPSFSVAIDGPSGAGKSSVAHRLSQIWGLFYLNTGLLYRAVAFKVNATQTSLDDHQSIRALLDPQMIKLRRHERVWMEGKDVTHQLRSDQISQLASQVSALDFVRDYVNTVLKNYTSQKGLIAEAETLLSVFCPEPKLRFTLTQSRKFVPSAELNKTKRLAMKLITNKFWIRFKLETTATKIANLIRCKKCRRNRNWRV